MDELQKALEQVIGAEPFRLVLSAPRAGRPLRRATLAPLQGGWQLEKLTQDKAFHQNLKKEQLAPVLHALLTEEFTQLTAFTEKATHSLRVTKKGRVLATRAAPAGPQAAPAPTHNKAKRRLIPEGAAVAPLVDIGVMTEDGRVAAAKMDKYRQINRFLELVDDALKKDAPKSLRVVDFGCGKSSLTFMLYHYLNTMRGIPVQMTGLDLKEDVVAACNAAAQRYGYQNLSFTAGDIGGYGSAGADMVVTLHACDTATDLALVKAVGWGARYIFSVPCCQHELNGQMQSEELAILCRYGIVKERAAALFTDAIRANLLTACGYKTQLVEFVDFEHTPKNIMIRAVKVALPAKTRQNALDEVHRLCAAFGLDPCLLRLLGEAGALPGERQE